MESDTIAAIVTPPGEGGVGIVRTSGPLSGQLAGRLFPRLAGPWRSHQMRHGALIDPASGDVVDEALGVLMQGPRSYTGEDVFEMQCHGSPLVLERVAAICYAEGCRQARPGEFTLRAFLNGRLDLSQAEAVIDVVRARTNAALDLAVRQMAGKLSARVEPIRHDLVGVLAHMEASVDFVEDDIPPQADVATVGRLQQARQGVAELLSEAAGGIVLREGATLAIIGSPNVGKSSIMNGLAGLDRSIVTPIAGTTRDTIEETVDVRGVAFRVIDTAGMTETEDIVESIGVQRSHEALRGADVVLLVLDGSRALSRADGMAIEAVKALPDGRRVVVALNKADLPTVIEPSQIEARLRPSALARSSTVQSGGLEELRVALEEVALGGRRHEYTVGNVRHRDALARCQSALTAALGGLESGIPLDLVSLDVRAAAQALGEITGHNVDDELLDRIFSEFCIGK